MSLESDNNFKNFLRKIEILEYIQRNAPCSTREIKFKFNIKKSKLYDLIDKWEKEGLLIKDFNKFERSYYSHFLIRNTPQLKIKLLSFYDHIISLFTLKYKETSGIKKILKVEKEKSKI